MTGTADLHSRTQRATQQDVAPGNAIDWLKRSRSFEAIALAVPSGFNSEIPGREPEYFSAAMVSEQFFQVLRTPMLLGRAFLAEEYQKGAGRVAILSYPTWRDRFGADASIVGQPVRLGRNAPTTIVGVMPPDFELRLFDNRFQRQPEPRLWLPKQGFGDFEFNARGNGFYNVVGRLRPGVSIEEAKAEFNALSAQLALENPETNRNIAAQIVPLRTHLVGGVVAAGGVTSMPFGEAQMNTRSVFAIHGHPPAAGEASRIYTTAVEGDYFRALGIPLLKGRMFDAKDTASSRQVVLVSQNAAQQYWPGADPIGSRVRFQFDRKDFDAEVIGVVGGARHEALDRPVRAELFLPYSQSGFYALTVVVRTASGSPTTLQAMKEQIWALDPLQTIFHAIKLDDQISWTLVARRFSLFLRGGFAIRASVYLSQFSTFSPSTRSNSRSLSVTTTRPSASA
jgi:hypothetical protein